MAKRLLLLLLILGILHLPLNYAGSSWPSRQNVSISRDHVSVWFEPPLKNESLFMNDNLEEMVNIVGGTFGTILINSPNQTLSPLPQESTTNWSPELLVPNLVAKYNLQNENKVKVIISFDVHDKSVAKNRIELAKFTADRANSIHPGTVDTILLLDSGFFPQNVHSKTEKTDFGSKYNFVFETRENVVSSRKLLGNKYKLGVLIPFKDYRMLVALNQFYPLSEIYQYVDLIVTLIYFDEFYIDPLEEYQLLQKMLDNWEKQKNYNMKDGTKIIPLISCRPPINKNFVEVSKFLECWQLMNDWARENNRSVIMYEAFDQYGKNRLHDAGWWRLKSEGNENVQNPQNESFFIAKVDESFGLKIKHGEKFNSQTSIYFNHRVRFLSRNKLYSEKELRAMLEVVSTRFSSIVIGKQPCDDPRGTLVTPIPLMVAKMHQQNQNNSSSQPLTIILNIFYQRDGGPDLKLSVLVAQFANQKFPGTVRTIAFYKFGTGAVEQAYWNGFRDDLKNKNETTLSGIPFGIYIDLADCPSFLQNEFPSVSNWITTIIVDISGSTSSSFEHQYVDSKLRNLFTEWRKCRLSFQLEYPQVDVALSVTCSQIPTDSSTIEHEANCWEIVNKWGEENQVEVIFQQAFETPEVSIQSILVSGQTSKPFGGWWKLKRKSEMDITVDSFEERFQDLLRNQNEGSTYVEEENSCNCETSDNVGLVVFFTLLIIACTSSIIFTMFWFHRKESMQPVAPWSSEMQLLKTNHI